MARKLKKLSSASRRKRVNWFASFVSRCAEIASAHHISGLIMLGFAVVGFLLANLPFTAHHFETVREHVLGLPFVHMHLTVDQWVQDGLLTVFFLVVGLDLKQELTTGSLSHVKAAAVPMIAAVGGMVMPALVFVSTIFVASLSTGTIGIMGGGETFPFSVVSQGWAIPTATDIAFSLAVLALFARSLPGSLRAFLMTLATVDDLLGIIVIALFFSQLNQWYWFVAMVVIAGLWAMLIRRRRIPWVIIAILGIALWFVMHEAGIHPTLAGVIAGLLTPAHPMYGEHDSRAERYKEKLEPISALVALPIYALFATGIHFETLSLELFASPIVLAVILALVIGKPVGIMCASWVSTHFLGLKLARGLRVRDLLPIATACGIGFTVAFLMASLAYKHPELSNEARFGVLIGSLVSAGIASYLLHRQARKFELANN